MKTFRDKELDALDLIGKHIVQARNPIVLCSFGKDSIVLLHLCLRFRKVPALFFRFSKFHEKHQHALRVMQDWDLEVYDMWPQAVHEYQHGEFFEILHGYSVGMKAHIHLFSGIRKREDGESRYLCAVEDLMNRPRSFCNAYPWDVTFHGHKGTDDPEIGGSGAIVQPVSTLGGTTVVVPFTDWTDEDIWAYIRKYDLPYDRQRYAGDETTSPDKYPTCYKCLDTQLIGQTVECPKYERPIKNIARTEEQHESFRRELIGKLHYCEVVGEPRCTPNVAHL
jgi:3'-phosphoadenosine 5'-phosphosulfate sulfotransferase (PAPS reductase)/FAD synthetase